MKVIILLSYATFLFLVSALPAVTGAPLGNETDSGEDDIADSETSEELSSESESTEAAEDQPFPFHEYQNESSNYVVVDDMIIRKDPHRAGLSDAAWPDGIVPYSIAYTISPNQRPQIIQAMKEITEAVPCIKFRPVSKEDTYNIDFRNDAMNQGCSSFVGWQNRKNQPIQLAPVCSKGNAIHEVIHALGFFHEQTRNDRDTYVKINFENIQPGAERNFERDDQAYPDADTGYFGVRYNYDSIMHYGKTYFSKNGQNTIDVLNSTDALGNGDNIGQRSYISDGDIVMLKSKYNCPDGDEDPESTTGSAETTPAPEQGETQKPTTKSPMCQVNPTLPGCKQ